MREKIADWHRTRILKERKVWVQGININSWEELNEWDKDDWLEIIDTELVPVLIEEIKKVENPYEGFEDCRQKILSILKQ
jgi:hypothetical protein